MLKALSFLAAALFWLAAPASALSDPVDRARAMLSSGINLDWWFREAESPPTLSKEQVQQIAEAGFRHIRVPIGPRTLGLTFTESAANCPSEGPLFRFLSAMRPGVEAGKVGLVLTIDSNSDRQFLADVASDRSGGRLIAVLECMIATARRVDQRFAEQWVVYSPASEPRVPGPEWSALQKRALDAVAAREKELFFLATPAFTSRIWDLLRLEKSAAPNVGYEFHYYEPFLFTHQGIAVAFPYMRDKSDVPIGASRTNCTAQQHANGSASCVRCSAETNDPFCSEYRRQKLSEFGPEFVRTQLEFARKWAEGRLIYIGEYGVNKGRPDRWGANPADRVSWLRVVSAAVKNFGFGRAFYELSCGMGLTRIVTCDPASFGKQARFDFDPQIVDAIR